MNSDRADGVRRIRAERFTKLREAEPAPFLLVQDPDRRERPQQTVERVHIRPGCTRQLLTRTRTGDKQGGDPQLCRDADRLRNLLPDDQTAQLFSSRHRRSLLLEPLVLACASILSLERARRRDGQGVHSVETVNLSCRGGWRLAVRADPGRLARTQIVRLYGWQPRAGA